MSGAPSFFNRAWPRGVIEELFNRATRIPDEYTDWTHGRMPWIKMTSNVQVNGDRKLRERKQLFSGNLTSLQNSYDLENRSEPKPGITNATIKDQGTAGALRKATVEFKVWSMEQIKYIEPLYMSLGTYVVLEWGWSTKSDGTRNTAGLSFDDMLGGQCKFAQKVKELQLSSRFNYDALKGKISNFSWSVNNVGGFDCSVDIMSMGSVLMSTPVNSTSIANGCKDSDDQKEEEEETEKAEELFPNSYAMMVFLYQEQVAGEAFEVPGLDGGTAFAGFPAKFDKEITEDEKEKDLDTESYNEELSYYITWDYFEEHIINRALIPEISSQSTDGQTSGTGTEPCCTGKSEDLIQDVSGNETSWNKIYDATKDLMPHLVDRRRVGVGALDSRGSITKNHPFLISSNPNVCLLPGQCHWDGYEEDTNWASDRVNEYKGVKMQEAGDYADKARNSQGTTKIKNWIYAGSSTAKAIVSGIAGDLLAEDNVASWTIDPLVDAGLTFGTDVRNKNGVLSNMLLNVRFLQQTLSEVETLAEYINKIVDSVNEACANYFDLQLIEDPDVPAIMRVVDANVHDLGDEVLVPKFPAVGQKSICREVKIDTKLSGPIAAEVMYGTSKKQTAHDMGDTGTAKWNMWNAEVIDMDHANIKMMDKVEEGVNACGKDEGDLESENTVKKIKASYIESRKDLADNVAKEQIDAANTAVKKRIEIANTAIVDGVAFDVNSSGVQLPLEIGVTLDGMSGIIWGLPMSVDYLPPRYDAAAFTITKVDHTIDDKGWTLNLETVMRPGIFATTGLEDKTPPPRTDGKPNTTKNTNNNQQDPSVTNVPEEETGPEEPPTQQDIDEAIEARENMDDHDTAKHYDVNTMRTSNEMIAMIKKFEGFERVAYKDAVNVWTIGYGTTAAAMGRPINPGDTISEEDAALFLEMHINETYEPQVKRYVTSDVTQSEFDALVSFVYNLGIGSLKDSTLLRKFNAGDHKGAAKEFKRWVKAGGKVLPGLVSRRRDEATHYKHSTFAKA